MNISFILLTHNSEHTIEDCLKNVEIVSDERIVVDDRSSDNTVTIAESLGASVYERILERDFSAQKNFALEKTSGEWVLTLDADEVFDDNAISWLKMFKPEEGVDGYWFRRKTFINDKKYLRHGLFYPDWQLRLFRNHPSIRYEGAVHEHLTIPNSKTKTVNADIIHHPAQPKYTSFGDFHNLTPYIMIEADELSARGGPLRLFAKGISLFLHLFFGGFLRGKGFLDGWAGFRAHILLASTALLSHWVAAGRKLGK